MASLSFSNLPQPFHPPPEDHGVEDHENELQRGRKRRRSSANSAQLPSKSGALRGRGRQRSMSQGQQVPEIVDQTYRSESPSDKSSLGRKYQRRSTERLDAREKKKRDQSPSRSRSAGQTDGTPKPRRRQRTRSRSRSHDREKMVEEEAKVVDGNAEDGHE